MLPLTFLEASSKQALAKGFSPNGSTPYPLVKTFSSSVEFIPQDERGPSMLLDALKKHAEAGHVLHKGTLKEPVINESRAGKADTQAATNLLVIDIDSYQVSDMPKTLDSKWLAQTAKEIVSQLPEPLASASFVANASASTGMKGNSVGLHLFFLLSTAVSPTMLKHWLTSLNFLSGFAEQLTLTPSRLYVKWIVDPVVARNAQLIYIAPPMFQSVNDPFGSHDERWALIKTRHNVIDIQPLLMNIVPEAITRETDQLIHKLRKDLGMPRTVFKYSTLIIDGDKTRVITNPNYMDMQFVRVQNGFAYWNLNGGDSNAYYHAVGNPEIVYNFKGEPPFIFENANKEMYDWFCETYKADIREATKSRPFAFRDMATDEHWAVEYNPATNQIQRMDKIAKQNLSDWFQALGSVMPEPMPQGEVVFDPHCTEPVKWTPKLVVNTFAATPFIARPAAILPAYHANYGNSLETLQAVCPKIALVIHHICGSNDQDTLHFLNWLAWMVQNRDKTHTSWIFSGVPGTGKGIFFERIMQPILGQRYALKKRLDHAEENFNAYVAQALLIVFDEFRLRDSKADSKLLNKLKDEITTTHTTLRAMRQDHKDIRSYTNYMFFSNHLDTMRIEEGDRRFNVATPQRKPLIAVWPEVRQDIDKIDAEVGTFAGWLFSFRTDDQKVRMTLENDAKAIMKDRAMYAPEQFCHAIKKGNLSYFYEVLDMDISNDISRATLITTAQKMLKIWSKHALEGEESVIGTAQLLTFYMLILDNRMTQAKFTSILKRNDLDVIRRRLPSDPQGNPVSTISTQWKLPDEERSVAETLVEAAAPTKSVANMSH